MKDKYKQWNGRKLEIETTHALGWSLHYCPIRKAQYRYIDKWGLQKPDGTTVGATGGDWRNAWTLYAPKYLSDENAIRELESFLFNRKERRAKYFQLRIEQEEGVYYITGNRPPKEERVVIAHHPNREIALCHAVIVMSGNEGHEVI